jgi:murein DD-endopeptidase MepM/ murein hydrolase activator NlpD
MKKALNIILISFILIFNFFYCFTIKVEARTLQDLVNELKNIEEENKTTKNEIKKTEGEINQIKRDINQIYVDMDKISKEIIAKTKEIEQLDIEIEEKTEQTKELMKFIQLSGGSSIYVEYIMGADTLTDFIYRISIAEQLSKYNSDLIDQMNNMIRANEKRKVDLNQMNVNLSKKQVDLKKKLDSLGKQRANLYEYESSLEEEIKASRQVIEMYQKAGCSLHERIDVCAKRMLPPDTRFWRPMDQGRVTSEYGMRFHPISGQLKMHDGIDLSNSALYTTKIYSTANGKVAKIGYDNSRGHYIIIHHNINGKNYTSTYLHLMTGTVNVKEGEVVTKNTFLAIMGTTGSSTGPHLHFSVATGLWYTDYYTYYDFVARTVNPRNVVNFPAGNQYWINRTTKY